VTIKKITVIRRWKSRRWDRSVTEGFDGIWQFPGGSDREKERYPSATSFLFYYNGSGSTRGAERSWVFYKQWLKKGKNSPPRIVRIILLHRKTGPIEIKQRGGGDGPRKCRSAEILRI